MTLPNLRRLPQDTETPLQTEVAKCFLWRYLYARSAESKAANDIGQDYLTWAHDEQTWAFCLCDGVSQSFFGNLAAQLLGDYLLEWFWKDCPLSLEPIQIRSDLIGKLQQLVEPGTEQVRHYSIPSGLPDLLQQVILQKQRHGSETTFVAGRIDIPCSQFPQGRLTLVWMGDSRLRLWHDTGELTETLGETVQTNRRWSTRQGLVGGMPGFFESPLVNSKGKPTLRNLLVYSDGLASIDVITNWLEASELLEKVRQADEAPTSDDISYLEWWLNPSELSLEPPGLIIKSELEVTEPPTKFSIPTPEDASQKEEIEIQSQPDKLDLFPTAITDVNKLNFQNLLKSIGAKYRRKI